MRCVTTRLKCCDKSERRRHKMVGTNSIKVYCSRQYQKNHDNPQYGDSKETATGEQLLTAAPVSCTSRPHQPEWTHFKGENTPGPGASPHADDAAPATQKPKQTPPSGVRVEESSQMPLTAPLISPLLRHPACFSYLVYSVGTYAAEQFRSYKFPGSHVQFTNERAQDLHTFKPPSSSNTVT